MMIPVMYLLHLQGGWVLLNLSLVAWVQIFRIKVFWIRIGQELQNLVNYFVKKYPWWDKLKLSKLGLIFPIIITPARQALALVCSPWSLHPSAPPSLNYNSSSSFDNKYRYYFPYRGQTNNNFSNWSPQNDSYSSAPASAISMLLPLINKYDPLQLRKDFILFGTNNSSNS